MGVLRAPLKRGGGNIYNLRTNSSRRSPTWWHCSNGAKAFPLGCRNATRREYVHTVSFTVHTSICLSFVLFKRGLYAVLCNFFLSWVILDHSSCWCITFNRPNLLKRWWSKLCQIHMIHPGIHGINLGLQTNMFYIIHDINYLLDMNNNN